MLVLTRKIGEAITVNCSDGTIRIVVLSVMGDKIRLGLEAPRCVSIARDEAKNKEPRNRS